MLLLVFLLLKFNAFSKIHWHVYVLIVSWKRVTNCIISFQPLFKCDNSPMACCGNFPILPSLYESIDRKSTNNLQTWDGVAWIKNDKKKKKKKEHRVYAEMDRSVNDSPTLELLQRNLSYTCHVPIYTHIHSTRLNPLIIYNGSFLIASHNNGVLDTFNRTFRYYASSKLRFNQY